ncbi:LysM peptidoglycan-binding domain-containing protein [bacterium]|nr:LysM peptidoglycan-binding domain-containing protein [bacterium]
MLVFSKKFIFLVALVFIGPFVVSCGGSAPSAKSSQSTKKTGSTGRMDYVEYNINKDLMANGLDAEADSTTGGDQAEVYAYHVEDGKWSPNRRNSIPLVHNPNVDRWIKAFNGPLRKNFSRWLTRLSYYGPIMEGIFRQYNLPPDLVYLGMIESGFNLNAYSHAAAAGPWQFIKSTGSLYGLQSGSFVDERRDLIKATHAAAQHLRDLYKTYGDWYLSFAAYNAGAGKVNSAIRKGGTRDYWKLSSAKSRLLRQETKDYVPKILAAAIISKNYRKYGYGNDTFRKPLDIEMAKVPDATDVYVLAKCAGVSVDEIRDLNPSLVAGVTPPGSKYDIVLPEGTADTFNENYCKVPRNSRANFVFHRVAKHETLYTIANKYKVPAQKIAQINNIAAKAKLAPGRIVMVPKEGKALEKLMAETQPGVVNKNDGLLTASSEIVPAKKEKAKNKKQRDNIETLVAQETENTQEPVAPAFNETGVPTQANDVLAAAPAAPEAPSDVDPAMLALTYRVQEGDTMMSVAQKFDISADQLASWNAFPKNAPLAAGSTIFIAQPRNNQPLQAEVAALAPPMPVYSKYKVKKGDTLSSIARSHDVWAKDIQEWNKMGKSQVVKVGQILKIRNVTDQNSIVASSQAPATPAPVLLKKVAFKPIIHRVKQGETLWDLAKRYRVSVNDLKHWNALRSNQLYPNQKIKIMSGAAKSDKVAMAL